MCGSTRPPRSLVGGDPRSGEDGWTLEVSDDGLGFDIDAVVARGLLYSAFLLHAVNVPSSLGEQTRDPVASRARERVVRLAITKGKDTGHYLHLRDP